MPHVPEVADDVVVGQAADDGLHCLLQGAQAGHHLGTALVHVCWHILRLVQLLVDVHRKVHHVGVLQQLNLALEDVLLIVHTPVLKELQQREAQVLV